MVGEENVFIAPWSPRRSHVEKNTSLWPGYCPGDSARRRSTSPPSLKGRCRFQSPCSTDGGGSSVAPIDVEHEDSSGEPEHLWPPTPETRWWPAGSSPISFCATTASTHTFELQDAPMIPRCTRSSTSPTTTYSLSTASSYSPFAVELQSSRIQCLENEITLLKNEIMPALSEKIVKMAADLAASTKYVVKLEKKMEKESADLRCKIEKGSAAPIDVEYEDSSGEPEHLLSAAENQDVFIASAEWRLVCALESPQPRCFPMAECQNGFHPMAEVLGVGLALVVLLFLLLLLLLLGVFPVVLSEVKERIEGQSPCRSGGSSPASSDVEHEDISDDELSAQSVEEEECEDEDPIEMLENQDAFIASAECPVKQRQFGAKERTRPAPIDVEYEDSSGEPEHLLSAAENQDGFIASAEWQHLSSATSPPTEVEELQQQVQELYSDGRASDLMEMAIPRPPTLESPRHQFIPEVEFNPAFDARLHQLRCMLPPTAQSAEEEDCQDEDPIEMQQVEDPYPVWNHNAFDDGLYQLWLTQWHWFTLYWAEITIPRSCHDEVWDPLDRAPDLVKKWYWHDSNTIHMRWTCSVKMLNDMCRRLENGSRNEYCLWSRTSRESWIGDATSVRPFLAWDAVLRKAVLRVEGFEPSHLSCTLMIGTPILKLGSEHPNHNVCDRQPPCDALPSWCIISPSPAQPAILRQIGESPGLLHSVQATDKHLVVSDWMEDAHTEVGGFVTLGVDVNNIGRGRSWRRQFARRIQSKPSGLDWCVSSDGLPDFCLRQP